MVDNVFKLKPICKFPGIDISKWNNTYEIAEDLVDCLKVIRELKSDVRHYNQYINSLQEILTTQKDKIKILNELVTTYREKSECLEILLEFSKY